MVTRSRMAALTVPALTLLLGVEPAARTQSLTGRLVDKVCYEIDHGNVRDSHPGMATDCATTCARKGSAVALLTSEGTVFEITGDLAANNNAALVPHIAHVVRITGAVTVHGDGTRSIAGDRLVMIRK